MAPSSWRAAVDEMVNVPVLSRVVAMTKPAYGPLVRPLRVTLDWSLKAKVEVLSNTSTTFEPLRLEFCCICSEPWEK